MTTQYEQQHDDRDANVEQVLRRTRFTTPAGFDETLLAAATRELAAPRLGASGRLWRRRAAIVLIAIGAAFAAFAYFDRPSLTLADVAAAYEKQLWVHVKYDNGKERWSNLTDGRTFHRDHDGHAVYIEADGLRLTWWPNATYLNKGKWFIGDKPPPRARSNTTPWDAYVRPLESMAATTRPLGNTSIERHADQLDGRKLVRFDVHYTDPLDRRLLLRQIWADPETRLPVQEREVLQLADRVEQKREAIVGRYAFPTTGPSSIHDLGVPRGLPVIDADAKPAEDVADILAKGEAARARWPKMYRMLVWQFGEDASLWYVDGQRWRHDRWFISPFRDPMYGGEPFPKPPATVEQIAAWFARTKRVPIDQIVEDGKRQFHRTNENAQAKPEPRVRVMESPHFPDSPNYAPGTHWPYVKRAGAPIRVEPPADAPKGIVILRREYGDGRTDSWIDPAKDYICVREVRQRRIDGQWSDERVEVLEDFRQVATGQWFAAKRVVTQTPHEPGISSSKWEEFCDVKVLTPAEIPADAFDGQKLVPGAAVETY